MNSASFSNFPDASAFAKKVAQEHKIVVRLVQHESEFIVEGKFSTDALHAVETKIEQLPQVVKTCSPELSETSRLKSDNSPISHRLCIECGVTIPHERVLALPAVIRCINCQSVFESTHNMRQRIDDGIAGTREENKRMQNQVWGEVRNRGRE